MLLNRHGYMEVLYICCIVYIWKTEIKQGRVLLGSTDNRFRLVGFFSCSIGKKPFSVDLVDNNNNNNNNNNLYLYSAVSTKKPTALNKTTYYKQINITLLI